MLKYKIQIDVECVDSELPVKRSFVVECLHDGRDEQASEFWRLGQDVADAIVAVSAIISPPYADFLVGVEDGLLDKSSVWKDE